MYIPTTPHIDRKVVRPDITRLITNVDQFTQHERFFQVLMANRKTLRGLLYNTVVTGSAEPIIAHCQSIDRLGEIDDPVITAIYEQVRRLVLELCSGRSCALIDHHPQPSSSDHDFSSDPLVASAKLNQIYVTVSRSLPPSLDDVSSFLHRARHHLCSTDSVPNNYQNTIVLIRAFLHPDAHPSRLPLLFKGSRFMQLRASLFARDFGHTFDPLLLARVRPYHNHDGDRGYPLILLRSFDPDSKGVVSYTSPEERGIINDAQTRAREYSVPDDGRNLC